MTRIKLCGLSREEDIEVANALRPEYIGFVFAKRSRRYVAPERAAALKRLLRDEIVAVGVFVDEELERVARLANDGIIDAIQLHGNEDAQYLSRLRTLTSPTPIIQAFRPNDLTAAQVSLADFVLIDAGAGDGKIFDWSILKSLRRKFFLAGGLNPDNVSDAIKLAEPFAVDVSSGIESNGRKDADKMFKFVRAVRGASA